VISRCKATRGKSGENIAEIGKVSSPEMGENPVDMAKNIHWKAGNQSCGGPMEAQAFGKLDR
jgi:hypothetical protein